MHKSINVDLNVQDLSVIRCNLCEYRCRYTIQLKKHMATQHKHDLKYSCIYSECTFSSDFIATAWDHKMEAHPDIDDQFTEKNRENFILKIVAEQTNSIMEEMESIKSDTKNAFIELAVRVKSCVDELKCDTNKNCKALGNTVAKIYETVAKLEKSGGKTNNIDKLERVPKSYAEMAGKAKGKKKPPVPLPSSPPSGLPSTASATSTSSCVPPPRKNFTPKMMTGFMQQPKVLFVGDSVGHTANLRIVEKSLKSRIKSVKA